MYGFDIKKGRTGTRAVILHNSGALTAGKKFAYIDRGCNTLRLDPNELHVRY